MVEAIGADNFFVFKQRIAAGGANPGIQQGYKIFNKTWNFHKRILMIKDRENLSESNIHSGTGYIIF
jgi:hypothetical protein